MKDQGQHRVSQTYLRQFGFRDKNHHWVISVYELGNSITRYEYIKKFTKETNLFNLDYFDGEIKTLFETNCSKIETHYPHLIKSIEKEGKLIPKSKELLIQYVPSLMCRNIPFRNWVTDLISHKSTRNKFFNEITMFEPTKSDYKTLASLNQELDIKFQVNFVMFSVMEFCIQLLSNFNFVILKDFDNRGWFTSDNPVVFNNKNNHTWTVPLESEFILPLNPTYCLYIYHPDYNENIYDDCSANQINSREHKYISDQISKNAQKYIIFPEDLGSEDLQKN